MARYLIKHMDDFTFTFTLLYFTLPLPPFSEEL